MPDNDDFLVDGYDEDYDEMEWDDEDDEPGIDIKCRIDSLSKEPSQTHISAFKEQGDADATLARDLQRQINAEARVAGSKSKGKGREDELDKPQILTRKFAVPDLVAPSSEDPLEILSQYNDLWLGNGICGSCRETIHTKDTLPERDPSKDTQKEIWDRLTLECICEKCGTELCRGCFKPTGKTGGRKTKERKECCAEVRAVAIFLVLCVLDDVYYTERKMEQEEVNFRKRKRSNASNSNVKNSGAGYGTGGTDLFGKSSSQDMVHNVIPSQKWKSTALMKLYCQHKKTLGKVDDDAWVGSWLEPHDIEFEEYQSFMIECGRIADPGLSRNLSDKKNADRDVILVHLLVLLVSFFPTPDAPNATTWDFLPHKATKSLLLTSSLSESLSSLLRNDSVQDFTTRSIVYFQVLAVLRALATWNEGIMFLAEPARQKLRGGGGIKETVEGKGGVMWEFTEESEGKKRKLDENARFEKSNVMTMIPLGRLLKSLVIQSDAFRHFAEVEMKKKTDAKEWIDAVTLCKDILNVGKEIDKSISLWIEDQQAKCQRSIQVADYVSACRELSYSTEPLMHVYQSGYEGKNMSKLITHHYHLELDRVTKEVKLPGKMMHLAKELATLSTSLPPGIWVKVDETRYDCIKVLISGPEDTPYFGGLWEFDLFIPPEYPDVSPQCWSRTTGNNRVRFNPNLYSEGKVCLSLLGTWPGRPEENWQPGLSTILQILISIQSMILCNKPYYNEPGTGSVHDGRESRSYNREVTLQTIRWAMLEWLRPNVLEKTIWEDIIIMHYALLGDKIMAYLKQEAKKDLRLSSYKEATMSLCGTWSTTDSGTQAVTPGDLNMVLEFESRLVQMKEKWRRWSNS